MGTDTVFKETEPLMDSRFGVEKTTEILNLARKKYEELLLKNASEVKAVRKHTAGEIYPVIAIYNAMKESGIDQSKALEFLDWSCSKRAEKEARSIQLLMKIPGLYRLMPGIFKHVTLNNFGEDAGFKAEFYDMGKKRVKFDMTKCLYCDVCKANGVPEIVPCFCHTDDVKDGNMHPKLIWNRSKIMGDGSDCCDFDLYIKD